MGATTRLQPDARASGTAVDSLPVPPEVGDFDVRIAERAALLATRIPPPYEPATLREKIHASLQRPGLARVDVLYLYQWQESALRPDTLAALQGGVADGLVGALGVSNFNVDPLGRALAFQTERGFAPFRYLQSIHDYAVSAFGAALCRLCTDAGVKRVGYSPLGAGFLTGKYRDGVPAGTRFDLIPGHQAVYFTPNAQERLAWLTAVAEHTGFTPGELGLASTARHPAVSLVLIGGRSVAQIAPRAATPAKIPPPPSTGSTTAARDSCGRPCPVRRDSRCFASIRGPRLKRSVSQWKSPVPSAPRW